MRRSKTMKLSVKLPLTITLPVIALLVVLGFAQFVQTSRVFERDREVAYTSLVTERAAAVERWLSDSQSDVLALSESYAIKAALGDFGAAWSAYDGDIASDLRHLYIQDNPNPLGAKDELVDGEDGSQWSAAHKRHHVGLRSFQRSRGYYNLFLFDTQGALIYSVLKEDAFALDFITGKYAESGLGEVFRAGQSLPQGGFYLTDIAPYAPSADAPAMFMSTPVFADGAMIGVVVVQLRLDVIDHIVSESQLLADTGEIYLVDNNGLALSNSRHEGGFTALTPLPELQQIQAALSGERAYFEETTGVTGKEVISKTADVETPRGDHWGMVFEIDRAEALKFVTQSSLATLIELAITAGLITLLVWFSVRSVTKRIASLSDEIETIAQGDYDSPVAGADKQDEIGVISRTLTNLQAQLADGAQAQKREKVVQQDNIRVVKQLSAALSNLQQGDLTQQIREAFPAEHEALRSNLNAATSALNEVIVSVLESADAINKHAQEISGSADDMSQRTESQAATLEQTVAALEEVTSSVKTSSEHIDGVETTVTAARTKAETGGSVVQEAISAMNEIEQSSGQISHIISVIDDIAFQTNLLALNAGVEAARAGEAGRGFAVVASEVRGLAQRSSDAAHEIKTLIETSGKQVARGVDMVGRTGGALTDIVQEVLQVSGMIEEIASSARQQATALSEINSGMQQLDQVTQGNAAMVEENTAASHMLRNEANGLIDQVGRFKTTQNPVRATPVTSPVPAPMPQAHPMEFEQEPQAANAKWADF